MSVNSDKCGSKAGSKLPASARCKTCGYAVIRLPGNRCPECGRAFDPADPTTFATSGRGWLGDWAVWLRPLGVGGVCATVARLDSLSDGVLGYLLLLALLVFIGAALCTALADGAQRGYTIALLLSLGAGMTAAAFAVAYMTDENTLPAFAMLAGIVAILALFPAATGVGVAHARLQALQNGG